MSFSLNEIEVTAKRAARGAGLDWGLAEEAGKAVRWLAARGLPGPALLAELLTRTDGKTYAALAPAAVEGTWQAPAGWLCPLIAGAALADRAQALAAGGAELGPTAFPLLLAPYAALAAGAAGGALELNWLGARLTLFPDGRLAVEGRPAALTARLAQSVHCGPAAAAAAEPPPRPEPDRSVDAEAWSRLCAFAQRTFAPATEASRLLGAGAGLTDND